MDHATNLLVATDDRVELAATRGISEVARVSLQRLVLIFGTLIGNPMRAAYGFECREQGVVVGADGGQDAPALGALGFREREKQMFGRDVLVAEVLRLVLGFVEDLIQLARERRLGAGLFRIARDLARYLLAQRGDARPEFL